MIYADQKEKTGTINNGQKLRLTAICSGSRGNGKTWLASTICHGLASKKKKILLFDADCGLENVAYQHQLETGLSYHKLLNGSVTLNNAVEHFKSGKFDVVCSPAGEDMLAGAPVGRVQILAKDLQHLSYNYDHVFIDCSDDCVQVANVFLNLCQSVILLVNTDQVSLTRAYEKLVRLKRVCPMVSVKIIINHAQTYEEGKQIYKSLLKASAEYIKLGVELLGVVRQDAHIRECVLSKNLILKRFPACKGAEDALRIIDRIEEADFSDV